MQNFDRNPYKQSSTLPQNVKVAHAREPRVAEVKVKGHQQERVEHQPAGTRKTRRNEGQKDENVN